VKDCCADLDPAVHACLIEKVFPRSATVLASDELLRMLATRPNKRLERTRR
jgi:hypothetical protein